ncbi:NADH-quinone oxidoreductase subunit NuoE [Candidatus Bipolaricaulota bacterium]|nr:NADH-quinone oxidoreductase subunit NuoE [Candidatus Bipolaricaulota bacterium]
MATVGDQQGGSVRSVLEKYPASSEYLLDMLHDLQEAEPRNFLSREALQAVAEYLGLAMSEIISAATFYSMYSLKPRGRHIIRICESPPCQLVGAESLIDLLAKHLEIAVGETTKDGLFTLETTSCLGICGVAPAMMIGDELYGNLTPERLREIIARVRREDETR